MPFPFLRLPDLAQFEVLLKLDPSDLIYFSSISSKTKSIAKLSNTKVGVTWKLPFSNSYQRIILENEQKKQSYLLFSVYLNSLPATSIHFDQEIVTVRRTGSTLRFGSDELSDAERKRLFEKLNAYILDIFKVKDYHLEGNIFLFKDFLSKHTKKLAKLTIRERDLQIELPNVLEEFSVKELEIERTLPYRDQLEFASPFKLRVLTCYGVDWLTMEAFWNMDCEKIVVYIRNPAYSEHSSCVFWKEIITRWIAGCWKNLKELKIRYCCIRKEDQMSIINGIRADRIDKNSFRIRRSDGTTAIVAVMEDAFMMTIEK